MRSVIDRTGEKRLNNCGLIMKIVAYRSANDLDVKFNDGTIVEHKSYNNFLNGKIKNPNSSAKPSYNKDSRLKKYREKIIGKINTANCGQKMIIIAVKSATDITVKFEDGSIVEHTTYGNFKTGRVGNPNCNYWKDKPKNDAMARLGEKRRSKMTGEYAEIVKYIDSYNITIRFENGVEKNMDYYTFKQGRFHSSDNIVETKRKLRIGKTSTSTRGQKMTIIAYRNSMDIDVQFEDGTIVEHTEYQHFKRGYVRNPNYKEVPDLIREELATNRICYISTPEDTEMIECSVVSISKTTFWIFCNNKYSRLSFNDYKSTWWLREDKSE